jgi:hypothetical protein
MAGMPVAHNGTRVIAARVRAEAADITAFDGRVAKVDRD